VKPIYTASGDWDAQMLRDVLVTRGIDAIVEGRFNPYPVSSGYDRVLIVNDEDEARAMEIVRDFHAHVAEQPRDTAVVWTWRCPNCREEVEPQFELCWNCGKEKPQS
jgi:hypothetical protein